LDPPRIDPPLIELKDVRRSFPVRRLLGRWRSASAIHAVAGVSLALHPARTLGLVGESGCGKTTTLRLVLGIDTPTAGEVSFEGVPLARLDGEARRRFRRGVQAVFQDPWSSLDPRMRVGASVAEPLRVGGMGAAEAAERVAALLTEVGLAPDQAEVFPHELSGGQRQRVSIARALALRPQAIVLDEPVSALDVSIRAQIINLLKDLQEQHRFAYLFVSHQLETIWSISDEVAVMYLGKIVEIGNAAAIRDDPQHPYTRALLAAAPPRHPRERGQRATIAGELPSPADPPAGCRFHPRCPSAMARCAREEPALAPVDAGRRVACFLTGSGSAAG
jgi:oligopeptide/dipeptide ABC transporter ATP-binding protein